MAMSSRIGKRSPCGRRSAHYLLGACAAVALSACNWDTSSSSSWSSSASGNAQKYGLSGTVSGLNGSGLGLSVNGSTIAVASGAKEIVLAASLPAGTAYTVRVATQPSVETCTVANGTGTITTANVGNVVVTCADRAYTLGGTISGLEGSGLVLANETDTLPISSGATSFTLPTPVAYSSSYRVTVATQPSGLSCVVAHGTGTMAASAVTNIAVSCTSFTESVLYSFAGGQSGGKFTGAGLIRGSDGKFYGTTFGDGANGDGTVFSITPAGVETLLYSFSGSPDDANPNAALIQGSDGNFYGTTWDGGANNDGTVFKITPAGVETVLYSFSGAHGDGASPNASLIQGSDGNFYGTTTRGGANGDGTVFRITPAGVETVLFSFSGSPDDANPLAALVQGSDGNFYGTTWDGGANSDGMVFRITPAGVETVLYSFGASLTDGMNPQAALIQGSDGNFYGTTWDGGANNDGVVFEIVPQ